MSNSIKVDILEVILKITECCNIACRYCYFFRGGNIDFDERPNVIKKDTIHALASFLKEAILANEIKLLRLDFHGGEPLMMGKKRFVEMVELFDTELSQLVDLEYVLQSNGTLIDDEWVEIFSKYNVAASVSLDGDQAIHDANRIDKKGRGTYVRATEGLKKLICAARSNKVVFPGIISVINDSSDTKITFKHFLDDLESPFISFVELDLTIDELNQETVEKISNNLLAVYNEWERINTPTIVHDISVRNFNDILKQLVLSGTEADKKEKRKYVSLTIRSDGSLNPDDILRNIYPYLFTNEYNIKNNTLSDYLSDEKLKDLYRKLFTLPEKCNECGVKKICRNGWGFGSIPHRYSKENDMNNVNALCGVYHEISLRLCDLVIQQGKSYDSIKHNLF
ncbi:MULTISPECIES: radical SAM protein [unclassified Gilliamella]|uniref:radical SAM protein n=1 Tax=unclassified Gilliamella TaxID=2685620 RepID=UPI00130C9275|nr:MULTISPECIES: radical SAM protein [unclassified Gilliamella]MWP48431.1 radical SAM protein [Gilliamella sp. Lep-s35]MWP68290.1 radical SAM protein [Gilliamella sp. Lep-s5]MWP76571.1 radical SAM protein [Gilliamella sp. Lep-s21]